MSYISDSDSGSYKRRIDQLDDNIEHLTHEVKSLNTFVNKTELECSLMTVKIKREKLKALSAIARAQVLMADMQVRLAEGELYMDLERLKNLKKMRLDLEEGGSQRHTCQLSAPPSTATVPIQTTTGTTEKKHKRHGSSRNSLVDSSSFRSPVDLFSDDTVQIPSINENTTSLVETSPLSQTSISQELFEKTPPERPDFEISLSNSVKEDFNNSFTQTQIKDTAEESPNKKHKSHRKSKTRSHGQKSTSVSSPKVTQPPPKTVDTSKNRSADKKSTVSAMFVQARHNNLPEMIPQPNTPVLIPTTQTHIVHAQDPRPYHLLPFYGSQP